MTTLTLLRNTATFGAAKFGNGLTAALSTKVGVLATTTSLASTVGTLEAWVKTTTTALTMVAVGNSNGSSSGMFIGQDATNVACFGTSSVLVKSSVNTSDGAWHHLALTADGTNLKFYVDGVLTNTTAYTGTFDPAYGATGTTTAVGGYGANASFDWTGGTVDEVRFSNTVRYTANFTVPSAAFTDDASTTALYHLEADGTDSHSGSDTTAPSVPGTPTATAGSASATVTFTGSTDNVAVVGYRVYSSADTFTAIAASGSASPITVTGLTNGTAYTFKVSAYDAAGNESAKSAASNSVTPTAPTGTIAANDAGIVYSPYNWDITSVRAATINPGAYFRCALDNATSITLNFDMTGVSSPVPRVRVRVDDGAPTTYDLAATIALTLPASNAWTATHTVEVVVAATSEFVTRWTPQNAIVRLTGITCAGTGVVTRPAVRAPQNVLIYGDSITEGYKTLKNVTTPDGSDVTVDWAYLLRSLLGVEVGVVGFGGQAWLAGGQGGVPALPSSYNLLWGGGPSRSFTSPTPDLIVINMGQNDSTSNTVTTVTAFLNTLLGAVASTVKIAVMRPFSGNQAANMQSAIAACTTPSRITYIDTTGWFTAGTDAPFDGVHPAGYASQSQLGPRTANAIRSAGLLGGTGGTSKRFVNVGGVAVAVGTVIKA